VVGGQAPDPTRLIDAVDLPIVVLGRDATLVHCNAAALAFLSLTSLRSLRPGISLHHCRGLEGLVADIEELWEHVMAGGAASQRELRTKDGAWFVVRVTAHRGADGELAGAVATFTNVTGLRVGVEQSIYEREYTKTILNTVVDPLVVLDGEQRIQTANRAFHQFFRISRDEAQGLALHDLGSGDWNSPDLSARLRQCISGADGTAEALEIRADVREVGRRTLSLTMRRMPQGPRPRELVLLSIEDISERRHAEEVRARLSDIVASSDDAIVGETFDGTITSWNPAAERIFGYTVDEALGRHISIIVPDERRGEQEDALACLRDGQRVEHFQTVRLARDGRRLDVSLTVSAIKDGEGRAVGVSMIARDITDRVRGEKALRHRTAQLAILVDEAPMGMFIVDTDFRVRTVNPQALPNFEGAGDPIGRDFHEVMRALRPAPTADAIAALFRRVLETGESHFVPELSIERRDGSGSDHYQRQVSCIPLPDGRRGVVCYFRDISAQVSARQTLAERERSLASEVSAMNRLHEMVGRLLVCGDVGAALNEVLDAAMTLVSADMGLVHLLDPGDQTLQIVAYRGFTDDSMERFRAGRPCVGTAYGEAFASRRRVVVEDVQADPAHPHREIAVREGWHGVQSTPLLARDGSALGVLSTHYRKPHRPAARDLRILDLYARQAADFIERMNVDDALRAADRRKDEFLATLAHELRNPLSPVRVALELMRRALGPSSVDRYLNVIERQVGNLEHIVDDLLEISRITRGKIELRKVRLDLSAAVSTAVETTQAVVAARKHQLFVSLPARPLFIEADPVRIEQILTNLLVNAAKYTEPGGRIWVSADRTGEYVEIRIKDTGIGIPAELLPRMFEIFEQGRRDLARSSGGLGIGLSIVKTLTDLHGGTVVATSPGEGQGSEFMLRFPTMPDDSAGDPAEQAAPVRDAETPRRQILVVDDNADAGELLAELLRGLGHDVRVAHDGPTAIHLVGEWHADVVFMDIGLPGMDGYAVAREIRRMGIDTQLIALTGYGHESARGMSRDAGFAQHLIKPPALEKVMGVLRSIGPVGVRAAAGCETPTTNA
jgi:PAS domain S-box-containing protein